MNFPENWNGGFWSYLFCRWKEIEGFPIQLKESFVEL